MSYAMTPKELKEAKDKAVMMSRGHYNMGTAVQLILDLVSSHNSLLKEKKDIRRKLNEVSAMLK